MTNFQTDGGSYGDLLGELVDETESHLAEYARFQPKKWLGNGCLIQTATIALKTFDYSIQRNLRNGLTYNQPRP